MQWLILVVVAIHALILLGHDSAHRALGVDLVLWQTLFAYVVIVVGPLVAAALVFTRRARLGYGVLAGAMLGALAFGVYHHYIGISPDHVAHLPPGSEQGLFKQTAGLMVGVELLGLALASWALARAAAD